MRPHKEGVFPGYMDRAVEYFAKQPAGQHILDLPAGNGKLTRVLRSQGHKVTPADINLQEEDFVYADMTKRLPFADNTFDGVICLEGVEHVLNPFLLIGELIRVSKIGGHVIVSTPNIMNMWSRLQFLMTGTFYQFHPAQLHDYEPHEAVDRFHISPMSYHRLRYLGDYFGARVAEVQSDKAKKAWLSPVYRGLNLLGKGWARSLFFSKKYEQYRDRNTEIYNHINSWPALTGRSLVMVYEKVRETTPILIEDVNDSKQAAA
ncbi:MAG: class I SAM-dependent methyltransferase [Rubinisphaera brasiliensis]|uniref:class I SAM-dependent methyltransferase n=1 Tax=Rubinisphaera TaxID=1649490 RepID=UPI001F2833BD|nr:class I SAM-dependent methyltransferase [Rubinisphaera sp. JC750]MBR9802270.1 class I SAM-dependent methyltransferase [bacterium]